MGNFSEVGRGATGTGDGERDLQDRRRSVLGFVTGRPAGMERLDSDIEEGAGAGGGGGGGEKGKGTTMPVYEVRNGRAELRHSLNGLGQNRWS